MPEFRKLRSDVIGMDDDALFWALAEPLWPSGDEEDEISHLKLGTPGQRALVTSLTFIRDVDNGGLEQALWNLEPEYIELVGEGLDLIGASDHAAALRSAVTLLFGEPPIFDHEERREILDSKDRSWREANLEPLNDRLYGEEELYRYFRSYVDANPAEFFRD